MHLRLMVQPPFKVILHLRNCQPFFPAYYPEPRNKGLRPRPLQCRDPKPGGGEGCRNILTA